MKPIPDRQGKLHFNEAPIILRELINLGRRMFLIQFEDGSTTFVFPSEVILLGAGSLASLLEHGMDTVPRADSVIDAAVV